MEFGDVVGLLIALGIPTLLIGYLARRSFALKEKKLEVEALHAAEKAAQYVAHSREVEARLAVVERILTDRGLETAAQIEALRTPRLPLSQALHGDEAR